MSDQTDSGTDIEVGTREGRLRGTRHADHLSFRGIPFAAPPVGALRFAAPQPPASWDGVRDAREFGPVPPQLVRSPSSARGPQDEDCLTLNVFTPATDAGRRPVFFWIHGGAFWEGAGSQPMYDGGPLAARGDVVVVTINYRLGAFGYLHLAAHGGDDWGAVSNAGQLDQIAALRWVRENIEAFGGDPDQVTIGGESAGAVAVCTLLAMPDAQELFTRAIAQSGTASRTVTAEGAARVADGFLDHLGIETASADAMQGLSIDEILKAQRKLGRTPGIFAPVRDGRSLLERPLDFVRRGGAAAIPLMIGTNRDETRLYIDPKRAPIDDDVLARRVAGVVPDRARDGVGELIETYRRSRGERGLWHTNNDIQDAIATDSRFRIPATRLAEAQALHQPATFLYLFDWESPAWRNTMGACHGLELPFVFGTLDAPGMDRFAGKGPNAERLSGQMMDAWIAFIHRGDPSTASAGDWPGYDADARWTMIFGAATRPDTAPFEEERAAWEAMLSPGPPAAPAG